MKFLIHDCTAVCARNTVNDIVDSTPQHSSDGIPATFNFAQRTAHCAEYTRSYLNNAPTANEIAAI